MGDVLEFPKSRFAIGELIHHRLFGYRGAIADVDPSFRASDEWYETMASVAERNLERDTVSRPIDHPMTWYFFSGFRDGSYVIKGRGSN